MTPESDLQSEPLPVQILRGVLGVTGVPYRILSHNEVVSSARDGATHGFGTLEQMAPTLILRSEQGYFAAVISGATRISYKKIKKHLRLRNVSLASPSEVLEVTGAEVGAVPMINPGLRTLIDSQLSAPDEIFGGCGIPHYSLVIRANDLAAATAAEIFDFTEPRTP